ncbi:hypothetical protein [Mesomycoplasma hyorhinis]|uniref:hypothetical protein n=1 Tax=Mesomycoplasma hyorhinis TaxID=2100 RepID=UPI001C05B51B|nr:hypothetical protein [Mesomycoplasma hyorhinis]
MKKTIFKLGDISQFTYALQPGIQHQINVDNTYYQENLNTSFQLKNEAKTSILNNIENHFKNISSEESLQINQLIDNTLNRLPFNENIEEFTNLWNQKTNEFINKTITEQEIFEKIDKNYFSQEQLEIINSVLYPDVEDITLESDEDFNLHLPEEILLEESFDFQDNINLVFPAHDTGLEFKSINYLPNFQKSSFTSNYSYYSNYQSAYYEGDFSLTPSQWKQIQKNHINQKDKLKKYIDYFAGMLIKNTLFTTLSGASTAIAWGLAAAYTISAFWSFGATAPMAAMAVTQATISTIFFGLSIKEMKEMKEQYDSLVTLYKSDHISVMDKIFSLDYRNAVNFYNQTKNNVDWGNFYTIITSQILPFNEYIKSFFNTFKNSFQIYYKLNLSSSINYILKSTNVIKLISNFKGFFNSINSSTKSLTRKLQSFAQKIISRKLALAATSIVNPISELLNLVDTIISISDVLMTRVLDIVLSVD